MANNFFNDSNKAYSENLNDGILVGNAFDWTVDVSLPTDTGGVFPNSSTISMAKVADVYISPNSNLSIGSTISNSSGSSQVYRLTVYPNFNRFGGFKSISLVADSGVTFYIANKGGTSPIASNLDYDNLDDVPELKVLKEYDIVLTIPNGKSVSGLEFVFQSSGASVSASLLQSNVTGLSDSLASKVNVSDIKDNLTSTDTNKPLSANQGKALKTLVDGKSNVNHNHDGIYVQSAENVWIMIQEATFNMTYMVIYVNPALRLVDFHYYRPDFQFSNTDAQTLLNTSDFSVNISNQTVNIKPLMNTPLASYNQAIVGGLSLDDNSTKITVQSNSTGSKNINLRGMWHF